MRSACRLAWVFVALLALSCAGGAKKPDSPVGVAPLDEPSLMASLRSSVKTDPAKALSLAEQGDQQFADSASAEERQALAIRALINLQRIGAARSRAYPFLERYPSGPYSAEVAAMTGVHVTPKGPEAEPR